jgi:hypothetical protein
MRTFDGTGKLWADTFADGRLLFMPPATAALLVLFNRNHNVSHATCLKEVKDYPTHSIYATKSSTSTKTETTRNLRFPMKVQCESRTMKFSLALD